MALGTNSPFSMHSGDTKTLQVTIVDDAGAVVDISGATSITWAISKTIAGSGEPKGLALTTKTVGSGITLTTDGTDGRCDVLIDGADTDALAGEYYHEMQLILTSTISTVLFGTVTISKDLI